MRHPFLQRRAASPLTTGSGAGRWLMLLPLVAGCAPDPTERPASETSPLTDEGVAREDLAEAVGFSVFNEVMDPALRGRLTLHVLLHEAADRARLSKTLRELLPERAAEDPGLVAIRAVAYYPIVRSREVEGDLSPVAWAEWIPFEGWLGDTGNGRGTNHRVYFYAGSPPPW